MTSENCLRVPQARVSSSEKDLSKSRRQGKLEEALDLRNCIPRSRRIFPSFLELANTTSLYQLIFSLSLYCRPSLFELTRGVSFDLTAWSMFVGVGDAWRILWTVWWWYEEIAFGTNIYCDKVGKFPERLTSRYSYKGKRIFLFFYRCTNFKHVLCQPVFFLLSIDPVERNHYMVMF